MKNKALFNNKIIDLDELKISPFDRGFMYGDGVFESLRTYNGKPFLLDEHLNRLEKDAKTIGIKIPLTKEKLEAAILKLIKVNEYKESYIKIIVTRGIAAQHGLSIKNIIKPNLIILVTELKDLPKKDWIIKISSVIKYKTPISHIKSLNYLENILAKKEAEEAGADEAILLSPEGYVAEGTISNIFITKKGALYTPPLSLGILPGITRNLIIQTAKKQGIKVKERFFTVNDLKKADEVFLTFSGQGIVHVKKII